MFNFINKILVHLHLRKKSDTTSIPLRELRPFWDFQLFNIEDHNRRSWIVNAYYAIWRFFHYNNLFHPIRLSHEIKWVIQRARRGWADCDTWNLDSYLIKVISNSLSYLKKTKQGIPSSMFNPEDYIYEGYAIGNPSEEGIARAEARWNTTIDKMIDGFKANERMRENLYEEELGEYPINRPSGVSADIWENIKKDRFKATQVLQERDKKLSEEGMQLFIIHFNSLWD